MDLRLVSRGAEQKSISIIESNLWHFSVDNLRGE